MSQLNREEKSVIHKLVLLAQGGAYPIPVLLYGPTRRSFDDYVQEIFKDKKYELMTEIPIPDPETEEPTTENISAALYPNIDKLSHFEQENLIVALSKHPADSLIVVTSESDLGPRVLENGFSPNLFALVTRLCYQIPSR